MRIVFERHIIVTLALLGCGLAAPALACDYNSPTDLTCGTSFNPANPLSPNNPANLAQNPNSPYFSEPVYADGIFSLFEKNPRIIYPAGPPQTCRQGLDCPAGVNSPLAGQLFGPGQAPQAAAEAPPYPEVAPRRHNRRHRRAQ